MRCSRGCEALRKESTRSWGLIQGGLRALHEVSMGPHMCYVGVGAVPIGRRNDMFLSCRPLYRPKRAIFTGTYTYRHYDHESHPKHEHYQTDTFEDYEDLRLVVWNGTTTGKYAIELGDDTDARTFETEENGGTNLLDDYVFDHNSGEFIQSNRQESSYQPLFSENLASPLPSQPMSSEDCIGDIDGTHIPAMVSGGREGSAHDSLVLTDALSRNNGLKVPGGSSPENEKEFFNLRHASLRNVIKRIFGSVILMNFQSN
ncbi:hypothetical protein ZIOFF_021003 [Zingiber officinale]|uniref:Uncharacterized protein n=1 Tax=Zingiber officinale TaxID=94328 RepID=A0A8J5LG67_ZINOF|nr:hypothetical protein ZIOFF_021003 [Zingiber officinale]